MAWKTKKAHSEYQRRYVAENSDDVRAYQADYRQKNRLKLKAYKRRWYLANQERILAVNQTYRENNKEKILELKTKWGKSQKGEISARKRLDKWLKRAGWSKAQYDHRVSLGCEICGRKGLELVVDHDHDTGYVRGLLCRRCNIKLDWAIEHYEIIGCYHQFSMEAVA